VAVSSVKLIVDAANAINPLKRVAKETKKVEEGVRDVNGRLHDAKGRFIGAGEGAQQASGSFKSLAGNLLKVAAAYGTLAAAQSAVRAGIQRIESERRLQSLAKGYGEVAALSNAATQASQRFGVSQTTANKAIAQVYARLRPVGVTLEDIVSTYNGFNTAARISGSTAEEASNAFTQLAQALGSGALRGDEFNSISEQVPGILTAISKQTGIAQGNLRKFAAEGGITADIVIGALKRIEVEGADQLADALKGPAQAIKDFENATEEVQVALTQDIVPQLAESFRGLAELITNLKGPIEFIGQVAANTLNQVNSLIVAATSPGAVSARRDIKGGLLPLNVQGAAELFKGTGPEGKGLKGLQEEATELAKLRRQDRKTVLLELMKNRLGAMDAQTEMPTVSIPSVSIPVLKNAKSGKGRGRGRAEKSRVDATKELLALYEKLTFSIDTISERERLLLEHKIAQQKITEQNLLPNEKKIAFLQAEQSHMESILSLEKRLANEQEQRAKKTRDAFDKAMKDEADRAQKRKEADPGFQMQKQFGELIKLENQVAAGATAIGDAFSNAFVGVISGAKSAQEGLAEMMQSVAKHFLDMATKIIAEQIAMILYGTIMKALGVSMPGGSSPGIQQALAVTPKTGAAATSTLTNFLSPRANGGPVSANTPYIVGERGPELMIPSTSGMVLSNSETRQQLTQQDSAMRSTEATRQQLNTQRNTMITNSTRETERMTEMMLSNPDPIDVRYESTVINNVEYVTAEQHRQGMAQAAERGRSLTLSALQGSVKTRKKVGLS
jgi:tape measure domain-containing protein